MNVVTERCPGCGRPFATEVKTDRSHQVICQHGHVYTVVGVQQGVGGRTFELEMKEEQRGAAAAGR